MDELKNLVTTWSLLTPLAHLHGGDLTASLDLTHPELGLQHFGLQGTKLPATIFSVARHDAAHPKSAWPLPLADCYVRGNDLIATYADASDWPYAPQIYWRADSLGHVAQVRGSLSLMLSVQTHLLDTHPRICVASQLPSCESFYLASDERRLVDLVPIHGELALASTGSLCCVLRRFANIDASYAEIVSTSDFRHAHVQADADGNSRVEWQLFADFLEKGVIRRARIHAAWLPRDCDVELAAECCDALQQAPLPLTA